MVTIEHKTHDNVAVFVLMLIFRGYKLYNISSISLRINITCYYLALQPAIQSRTIGS